MKKGQIAFEFLTTYGWAFLVILVMISTLTYFGILSPSKLLPDRCNFGVEFECNDFQISDTSNSVRLRLTNNLGEPITVVEESLRINTPTMGALCPDVPEFPEVPKVFMIPESVVWSPGSIREFVFLGCLTEQAGFVVGEKGKVLISIDYYAVKSGEAYTHKVNGEIFATVT
ncbi:hypothetical protein KY347_02160 [Candidatus Woesearchaeota archaeon]|nr:hypothetical protein [Candidatus Woesearchaeota archaeon]